MLYTEKAIHIRQKMIILTHHDTSKLKRIRQPTDPVLLTGMLRIWCNLIEACDLIMTLLCKIHQKSVDIVMSLTEKQWTFRKT